MKRLKIGVVAELKSGSHAMTVGCIDPKNESKVMCNWAVNVVIKEKSLFKDQLKIVESEDLEHLRNLLDRIKG